MDCQNRDQARWHVSILLSLRDTCPERNMPTLKTYGLRPLGVVEYCDDKAQLPLGYALDGASDMLADKRRGHAFDLLP